MLPAFGTGRPMRRAIVVLGLVVYEMFVILVALYLFDAVRAPQPKAAPPALTRIQSADLQPPYCMCHHRTSPHNVEPRSCNSNAGRRCHPEAHTGFRIGPSTPVLDR